MKAICNFRQFNSIAKQAVQMHGGWLAINSLDSDRTPEGIYSPGLIREGWDG
jgi:hypothetical protein